MTASRKQSGHRDGLQMGRREALLAGLGAGVGAGMSIPGATAALALDGLARLGVVPSGGAVSQTATLQQALNQAAASGTPLFLPAGIYKTGTLTLEPGTHVHGVPGRTILESEGRAILSATRADGVHLTGLVLDGGALPLEKNDALLAVAGATELDVSDCRFLNSGGNGVNLHEAAGRIAHCTFSNIAGGAVYVELGFEGALIANNIVDTAATGISVTSINEGGRPAVVQGNIIRNLFFRKTGEAPGSGIAVGADASVRENVVQGAPAYGILVGRGGYLHDVSVTGNVVRKSHIGIGVAASSGAAAVLIADNLIDGAQNGAIRAMKGETPTGSDLANARAGSYRNLAFRANVMR
jgi:putative cofactor-binding repeat protein